jgi:hypothetical protein
VIRFSSPAPNVSVFLTYFQSVTVVVASRRPADERITAWASKNYLRVWMPMAVFKGETMKQILLGSVAVSLMAVSILAADPEKKQDRAALEQAFSTKLSGSLMSGAFSLDGRDSTGKNSPDKYRIISAKKVQGDDWVITAKMKIGENEVDVPVPVKIYWADDTPVMSLTDLTIPGMGTFTARIMFYGNRYAGTWQHGDAGGHMWGMIEKPAEKK